MSISKNQQPTIYNKFARTPGQFIIPELWRSIFGAWNPGLGPRGQRLYDRSKGHNHTTSSTPTRWTSSERRLAVNTDSLIDSHILVLGSDPSSLSFAHAVRPNWSMSAWIYPNSFSTPSFQVVYGYGNWQCTLGLDTSTGRIEAWRNNATSTFSTTAMKLNEWNHIAISNTDDGSNDTVRFYLNGVPDGSTSSVAYVNAQTTGTRIGAIASNSILSRFDGFFDDILIHERVLTSGEYRQLWELGRGGIYRIRSNIVLKTPIIPSVGIKTQIIFISGDTSNKLHYMTSGTNLF